MTAVEKTDQFFWHGNDEIINSSLKLTNLWLGDRQSCHKSADTCCGCCLTNYKLILHDYWTDYISYKYPLVENEQ